MQLLKEQMDRSSVCPTGIADREVEAKLCNGWTEVLTAFMEEHLKDFASSKGRCDSGSKVEGLVRKWGYVVRLADWCYHDGILTRHMYNHWVLSYFQSRVEDVNNASSWSVEMMMPLISNIFPEICRLRTDVPELVRVCVTRVMREVLSGIWSVGSHSTSGESTPLGQAPTTGSNAQAPTIALISYLQKLVQSLLIICPEAFLSLTPDVQAAWRLIETDTIKRDLKSIRSFLRCESSVHLPSLWLSTTMPWSELDKKGSNAAEQNGLIERCVLHHFDEFCSGSKMPWDVQWLWERVHPTASHNNVWKRVFDEHWMGRMQVFAVCGWATSRHRGQYPEAFNLATSFLRILGQNLIETWKLAEGQPVSDIAFDPNLDTQKDAHVHEYALQGFLELFLADFTPDAGAEEEEMSRLERLFGELIRARLFDHSQWVHNLMSKGAFDSSLSGDQVDASIRRQRRLLANLPWIPESPHDMCQRNILLRNVGLLDLDFMAKYYALKVNKYLFLGPADHGLSDEIYTSTAAECFECFSNSAGLVPAGALTEERIADIEWEETVNSTWLQNEKPHHDYADPFMEGIFTSQAQSILLNSLCKILSEAPLFVRSQLTRHICTVVKLMVGKGTGHVNDLDLINTTGIPQSCGLSDDVLMRATTLLELSGDSHSLVLLLQWLMGHDINAGAAISLRENLHVVKAMDLTCPIFSTCASALARVEAAGKVSVHTGTAIKELMCVMAKQSSDACVKHFEDSIKGLPTTTPSMQTVLNTIKAVRAVRENGANVRDVDKALLERDSDLCLGGHGHELSEAIKNGHRPELAEVVAHVLTSREPYETLAETVLKRMHESGLGHGLLVSTVLRAVVNGMLNEYRFNFRFGCTGFATSAYASLLWNLDKKVTPRLSRILLHIVMERMYDPSVVPCTADDTSPSTVDTPQPQTPFSPQTPDSTVANPSSNAKDAAEVGLRQEAALAFVGVLLARGQLSWEDVEQAVKAKLEHVVNSAEKDRCNFAKLLLKFVELLLTDKLKGAGAMMPSLDWQKLCLLRQTQSSIKDVYLMLKYLAQLTEEGWKQPALACIQHVVHDAGFCRLASRDDPHLFFKECAKPCMQFVKLHNPDIETAFSHFSFSQGHKSTALEAVECALSHNSQWSSHFACTELRIQVSARKVGLGQGMDENLDGIELLKSCKDENLQKILSGFLGQLSERSRQDLSETLKRPADAQIEHHTVTALLATLWRQPTRYAQTIDFAKGMGKLFAETTGSEGWFEGRMFKVLFMAMSCEPIARGCMGLDTFFKLFLHPLAPATGKVAHASVASTSAHCQAFENALVGFVGAYPLSEHAVESSLSGYMRVQPDSKKDGGPVRARLDFVGKVIQLTCDLVSLAEKGDYDWDAGSSIWNWKSSMGPTELRPRARNLQLAVILRLRLIAAGLSYLPDEGADTKELLQRAMQCLKSVYTCQMLLSDDLGSVVHKTCMLLVDKVGSLRPETTQGARPSQVAHWFREEVQRELLVGHKLATSVHRMLTHDLSVRFSSLTSEGMIFQPFPPSQLPQTVGFEGPFDVDPWLLLEDFPSGVLSSRVAHLKKRSRTHLSYEFVSPNAAAMSARAQAEAPPADYPNLGEKYSPSLSQISQPQCQIDVPSFSLSAVDVLGRGVIHIISMMLQVNPPHSPWIQ